MISHRPAWNVFYLNFGFLSFFSSQLATAYYRFANFRVSPFFLKYIKAIKSIFLIILTYNTANPKNISPPVIF